MPPIYAHHVMSLLLSLQTPSSDDSNSGGGGLWEFLNAPVEMTWMHTLFQGMVAAFVSAAVALLVLMVTVRTQNRGIQRQIAVQEKSLRAQLEAQEKSVAEQLRVQRRENARSREVAIVGRMLITLNEWEDERGMLDIPIGKRDADMQARLTDLIVGFEELRINGNASLDAAIDSFKSFAYQLSTASRDCLYDEDRRFENPGMTARCLGLFLVGNLVRYAPQGRPLWHDPM